MFLRQPVPPANAAAVPARRFSPAVPDSAALVMHSAFAAVSVRMQSVPSAPAAMLRHPAARRFSPQIPDTAPAASGSVPPAHSAGASAAA